MSECAGKPVLSRLDELSVQQVTGVFSYDFAIEDVQGNRVATISTTGSMASRFFAGSREFEVSGPDGVVLFRVQDPMTWGRDRYRVTAPDGSPIAELVQKVALFKTSVLVSVVDGTELRLEGSFFDYSYRLLAGQTPVAAVERKWAGLGKAMLGHSRYALLLEPGMPELVRYAVIGSVIALDLIRDKAQRRNTN